METATAGPNGREQLDVAVAVVASVWSEVLGIETPGELPAHTRSMQRVVVT